ncbi:MAG: sulfite exporter TauE/SafE family protein [Candidatus Bathyarchaeota archaeon]|nr:sulfite exporter TauE/SafE family protein [Candidatus Bathyarchaeota archaeon]
MSLLPEVANPYIAALAGGFLYGLVFCTSTCLPYVASYIAGINAGFRKGVGVTVIFNAGRITAYALIGAAVGALNLLVNDSFLSAFQTYSALAFSLVTIAIGVTLLVRNKQQVCNCAAKTGNLNSASGGLRSRFDVRAYTLGLSRGLVLCTPLMALLVYSLTFASPFDSFVLAVLFGVGTSLSPLLLIGGATGWLLNKAPLFRVWISRLGAAALIVLGLITLVDAIII